MPLQKRKAKASIPISLLHQERPTFGTIMKEGFAFGVGNSIAHRIFGPTVSTVPTPIATPIATPTPTPTPITVSNNLEYVQCMKESQNNVEACKHLQ